MNKIFIELLRKRYPAGTRLECICMDDFQAVPPGTQGTVTHVDDMGTIHMHWDNGSSLGLIYGEDNFKTVREHEMIQTM
ncbi:MAG: DUF4314 domain-containing protein [Erysipelotrichaceae bacterium]|nr:DUF4314 domain-containing protein [Erysipelotrichaceae bacterium]